MRLQRKNLRDKSNVLEMPDEQFLSYLRMDKNCFKRLLDEMIPHMKPIKRSSAIPPLLKLVSFLRFLAVGSYQSSIGNEYVAAMSQTKVSNIINECLDIVDQHICPKWIRLPSYEEEVSIKEQIYDKFELPGVIGCVDGTHIKVKSTRDHMHLYYNRKGYYSINAMVVCDYNMVVRYVDARSPGASNDAFIWRLSNLDTILKTDYDEGKRNTWLISKILLAKAQLKSRHRQALL